MDQLSAHQRAQDVFAGVLARVTPDQLSSPTPCSDWDARALIEHVIGGNNRVGGRSQANAVSEAVAELRAAHQESAAAAQGTFAEPEGLTRTFELPFGSLPGSAFIGLRTTDVFVHAWDLARATGQATDLDAELARETLNVSRERIRPDFRGPGKVFALEQECPPDRPPADQLAAFLGRAIG